MSWKTAATVITVIFMLVSIWTLAADPLISIGNSFQDTGDNSNEHFDGDSIIDENIGAWFDMILVGVFGLMAWAGYRVLRRELTRGGGGGGL